MNHYEYIDIVGKRFSDILGVRNIQELVSAHGDKCYAYMYGKTDIEAGRIVCVFLLSYVKPYSETVRDTEHGWVDVQSWINYKLNDPMINEALTLAENIELYKVGI